MEGKGLVKNMDERGLVYGLKTYRKGFQGI